MAKSKTIDMVKSQVIYKDYSKDAERTALVSGENLSHAFGKIARWYTDISWVGHKHVVADITDFPLLGTAASKDVPASGDAGNNEVVMGNDSRLTDARTPTSHTHTEADISDLGTYAGSSTKGGAATSANKLNIGSSDIGSETKPVYFNATTGKPVACAYSLNASVPANAVFTDINVKQSPSTANESREVLFAGNTGNTETVGTTGKSNKLYFNPNTGALTATSFSGSVAASNLTGTIDAGRLPTTSVTAGSYGPAAGGTLAHGGTFDAAYVTVDKYGRLTAASTKTFTLPAQYVHPSYTAKTSGLYKITVDSLGHVSGATAVTASDLPSHTHPYIPLSGSTAITGELRVTMGETAMPTIDVSNGTYRIGIHVGSGGVNHGIYDFSTGINTWMCYHNGTEFLFNGKANTAGKWATARKLTIGSSAKTVDGSGDVSWSLSEIGAAPASHTHQYAKSSSINGPAYSVEGALGSTTVYRHVWFSVDSDDNRRAYNDNFKFEPSRGIIKFNGWLPIDLTGQTANLNDYNDSGENIYGYRRYICKTTGGGSNISNKAVDAPFVLEVILIRWASTTDYITKQIYHGFDKKTYQRFCTNGTWSAWTEQKYTDTVYTHPSYTAKTSGLYKITVDATGHVSGTAAVAASDLPAHTHAYLPLTGGTMTGAITFQVADAIKYNASSTTTNMISFITGASDGHGVRIGGGGLVVIGSGESSTALVSALSLTGNTEQTYIASDNNITFYSKCQTIGERLGIVFDNTGRLRPDTDNTRTLGGTDFYWNKAYITQVVGRGTGGSWILSRDNAIVRQSSMSTNSAYFPVISAKTKLGEWSVGTLGPTSEHFYLSYTLDTNYSAGTNTSKTYYISTDGWFNGTAAKADAWTTARTLTLTGSVTGSASIDGSGNVSLATTTNHTHSQYLPLVGGTMTGILNLWSGRYDDNYALNCNNSTIIGANAIKFADLSDSAGEGIMFYRSTTTWDSVWAKNGVLYFTPNHPTDTTNNVVYHSGNLSISRSLTSGTKIATITLNGTATDLYCEKNTNTTYTISTGDSNGQIKVAPSSGSAYNVSVKGLGSAAYTASTAYAAASHTHSYLPLSGGTMTGDINFTAVTSTEYPAKSKQIYFSGSTDWAKIYYQVDASDAGRLVFDIGDDTNTRIVFANSGTAKSYIDANGNFSGNAATATTATTATSAGKWTTARTLTLTGSVTGSASIDGSGNVSLATTTNHTHSYAGSSSAGGAATSANKLNTNAGTATNPVYFSGGVPAACTYSLQRTVLPNYSVNSSNTTNYPYHLLCSMKDTTAGYKDYWAVFRVTPGYHGQYSGVYKVAVRMNNGSASSVSVNLLSGYPYLNDVAKVVAGYSTSGTNTYLYVFLVCPTYARTTVSLLQNGNFTFYSSNEVADTTTSDKKTSVNVYATLAAAGTALVGGSFASTITSITVTNYANIVSTAVTDPSSSTSYGILFAETPNTSQCNYIRKSNDFRINHFRGAANTEGLTEIVLGNSTASTAANNSTGRVTVYNAKGAATQIVGNTNTSTVTITLPSSTGTLALTGHTHSYLPLSGGTMTGAITFQVADAIKYNASSATYSMISFITGTADGHGIRIGGGGAVVIGSGESSTNLVSALSITGQGETTYVSSDNNIEFYSGCQTIANRKNVTIDTNGHVKIGQNQSFVQLQRNDSNYTCAIKWWKNSADPGNYGPEIGQHNTGDTDGSICILPYHTTSSPWEANVGLYISKTRLRYNGTAVSLSGHTHDYLPLSGGTISSSSFGPLVIKRTGSTNGSGIKFYNQSGSTDVLLGAIGMSGTANGGLIRWNSDLSTSYKILDTGNFSVSRSLTSGTKIATITVNGTATDLYCQTNTNTDTLVTQTNTTADGQYRVVLSGTNDDTTRTETARKSVNLRFNPGTSRLFLRGTTTASVAYGSTNPAIRFENSNASQNIELILNDFDSICKPASLAMIGNQGGEYLLAPNISAWDFTNNKWCAELRSFTIGTTSTVGEGRVVLGNGTKKGTAGNAKGVVEIYSEQNGCVFLEAPKSLTESPVVILPSTAGTMTDIVYKPTSAYTSLNSLFSGSTTITSGLQKTAITLSNHFNGYKYILITIKYNSSPATYAELMVPGYNDTWLNDTVSENPSGANSGAASSYTSTDLVGVYYTSSTKQLTFNCRKSMIVYAVRGCYGG